MLPTLTEICEDQKYPSDQPELIRVLTEGPDEFREIAPVFIIQGIAGKLNVKELAKKLVYPTYCTVLPCSTWSIEKLAETYVEVRSLFNFNCNIKYTGKHLYQLNLDLS